MTIVELLKSLKIVCEDATKNMILPTAVQSGDKKRIVRPPEFYLQRLPQSENAKKLAPYGIIQFAHGQHIQKPGNDPYFFVDVRFVFCVYGDDEQDGAIMLLNFMECIQQRLLKDVAIGRGAILDVNEPLEMLAYPDDTAPYFAGEMAGTFVLPPIKREVDWNELKKQVGNGKTVGRFGSERSLG